MIQFVFLFFQPLPVIPVKIKRVQTDDPPAGIAGRAVHKLIRLLAGAEKIHTFFDEIVLVEHGEHGPDFRVKIAHPDQTVPFYTVINIFLTVQMDRVCACLPDPVQPLITAPEKARIIPVPVDRADGSAEQMQLRFTFRHFQTDKPERGIAEGKLPQHRQLNGRLMDRMVGGGCLQRFRNRFSQRDPHMDRLHGDGCEAESAVQFLPEVKNHALSGGNGAVFRIKVQICLRFQFAAETLRIFHILRVMNDPDGRNPNAFPFFLPHAGIDQFTHHYSPFLYSFSAVGDQRVCSFSP